MFVKSKVDGTWTVDHLHDVVKVKEGDVVECCESFGQMIIESGKATAANGIVGDVVADDDNEASVDGADDDLNGNGGDDTNTTGNDADNGTEDDLDGADGGDNGGGDDDNGTDDPDKGNEGSGEDPKTEGNEPDAKVEGNEGDNNEGNDEDDEDYTLEELNALGMSELRVLGDHYEVKDSNKKELADKVFAAQNAAD